MCRGGGGQELTLGLFDLWKIGQENILASLKILNPTSNRRAVLGPPWPAGVPQPESRQQTFKADKLACGKVGHLFPDVAPSKPTPTPVYQIRGVQNKIIHQIKLRRKKKTMHDFIWGRALGTGLMEGKGGHPLWGRGCRGSFQISHPIPKMEGVPGSHPCSFGPWKPTEVLNGKVESI